jgi:D-beta-D-heptose 7-phosphate kinase/D-beta-D-heptose 1-phosphate adenosyltransferase
MRPGSSIQQKQYNLDGLLKQAARWRLLSRKIAFTNGCFDILHAGHIASLTEAAQYADVLVVGINADASVRKLKGTSRPVNDEKSRALLIASLAVVDAVIIFGEHTPLDLIRALRPDVLVKGGDYRIEDIAGATDVLSWGGQVFINPIVPGFSTTGLIDKIQAAG